MLSWRSILAVATNLFPLWVVSAGVLALFYPPLFTWFTGPWIVWGLAVIMLGMGITLSVNDCRAVLRMPKAVGIGFIAQYTIMPAFGWGVAKLCGLPPEFAAGLILVACCPGGTASNVVAYLARANVALSVLMTMCSTFGAVVMTPVLTKVLAGTYVPVNAWGLFVSTAQVVLAPLLIGLALNEYCSKVVQRVLPVAPLISVVVIALICASIIGQSATFILESGGKLLLAVFLLHAGGFLLGYWLARVLGYAETIRRTISIEVGMQNSGLGAVLARQHFSAGAAVPCAISSVFHSVIGSLLAAMWRLSSNERAAPGRTEEQL
jgi:BASS family bile acid:Na+ symporter